MPICRFCYQGGSRIWAAGAPRQSLSVTKCLSGMAAEAARLGNRFPRTPG
jgi:hypothetical protein